MMPKLKVGLLPLYIKLYDDSLPEMRSGVEAFCDLIARELARRELEVVRTPICRIKEEFRTAISRFEKEDVDAIISLHVAYSPSLESVDLIASSDLPLVVLNTTPGWSFSPTQDPSEMLYNHGIHGVQDFCNVLLRKGKDFQIEAGHWEHSDVLERVVEAVKVARLTAEIRSARVGRIGEPFVSMGDFLVDDAVLKSRLGIETVTCQAGHLQGLLCTLEESLVQAEMDADREVFETDGLDAAAHDYTTRACLAVRRWVEDEKLSAFSFNFLHVTSRLGLPTVPFLEASKAMARGIGYAGEGDVMTAALVGALASVYRDVTFTEMFCPDWEHNAVYLSHMGEMNWRLAVEKPRLVKRPYAFTDVEQPVAAVGRFRGGKAVLVDLAPLAEDEFRLIISPVEMLSVSGEDRFGDSVHGWFRPSLDLSEYLAEYSRKGGTHHFALVYGTLSRALENWAKVMGWEPVILA